MTVEQIIAMVMAQRAANGFDIVVTFDNRVPFNYYAKDKADFDLTFSKYEKRIGKVDEVGTTVVAVRVA